MRDKSLKGEESERKRAWTGKENETFTHSLTLSVMRMLEKKDEEGRMLKMRKREDEKTVHPRTRLVIPIFLLLISSFLSLHPHLLLPVSSSQTDLHILSLLLRTDLKTMFTKAEEKCTGKQRNQEKTGELSLCNINFLFFYLFLLPFSLHPLLSPSLTEGEREREGILSLSRFLLWMS